MAMSEEAKKRVAEMWAEDLSANEITRRLNTEFRGGYTRNMVIGHAHRASLPPRTDPIKKTINPRAPRKPAPSRQPKPKASKMTDSFEIVGKPPTPLLEKPVPAGAMTLEEAQAARGCRWEVTNKPRAMDYRFCGQPIETGARFDFCPRHLDKATTPAHAWKGWHHG